MRKMTERVEAMCCFNLDSIHCIYHTKQDSFVIWSVTTCCWRRKIWLTHLIMCQTVASFMIMSTAHIVKRPSLQHMFQRAYCCLICNNDDMHWLETPSLQRRRLIPKVGSTFNGRMHFGNGDEYGAQCFPLTRLTFSSPFYVAWLTWGEPRGVACCIFEKRDWRIRNTLSVGADLQIKPIGQVQRPQTM